jgi:hypothetical protein
MEMRYLSFGVERRSDRSRSQEFRRATANRRATWIVVALVCLLGSGATATSAAAETATYSATQTVPVPPASNFAGSGGGDGWAVALSDKAVYNVFHHSSALTVACHLQANAEPCWSPQETRTITEGNANFSTSGHPGMYLDRHTGKLYVYATRSSDATAGVVCVDTEEAPTNENPFCGFTELTQKGEAPLVGISAVSNPMLIGTRWYAFSFANGVQEKERNTLLCFDVSTDAACAGQPYAVAIGPGAVSDGGFPSPATAAIGSKVIIPLNIEGTNRLACFDDTTQSSCAGSWPVTLKVNSYAGYNGAPFPLLEATGKLAGLCIPTGTDECFNLQGEETATPAEMPSVIEASDGWNGPAFVLGPRVYVPNGNYKGQVGDVECFDYATGAGCANFPKEFKELGYLYTVNQDPQRPTCIWVNSDYGSQQIQNFDAYTGEACGQGTIRVLASQFVVAEPQCTPASYISLQVLKPARSSYSTGSVAFADGDGNPIGLPEQALDETGTISLAGLELNTSTGLPQFLFTLNGESEEIGAVEIKLTWTGDYNATCVGEKTTVTTPPQQTTTATPTSTPTPTPVAKGGVSAFRRARLAGHARACIASRTYRASVSGKLIASVTFKVNGHRVAKLTKPNSHGRFTKLIKLGAGHKKKLVIQVAYTAASGSPATKIKRTLARCAVHHRETPRFTG